jgi:hypothetical protein
MNTRHSSWRFRGRVLVFGAVAAGLIWPLNAQAAKYGNSLDWVPADSVFYSASLRLHEQLDIVAKSKAWDKLKNLPVVQMGYGFFQMSFYAPGGPGDQVRDFLAQSENKELVDLVCDSVSSEVVMFGDRSSADFVDIALRTMNAVRYGSMMARAESGANQEDVSARILFNSLDANRDKLSAPGVVFGFKLTDVKRAQNQLKRLEDLVKPQLEAEPQLRGRLKHTSVSGIDYLALELDGSMVPWDQVPWQRLEDKPGQYDKLREKLRGLRLVIYAGVRNDYLLFAIGSSPAQLAALGQGTPLADVPELAALAKYSGERLTEVNFVSKSLLASIGYSSSDFDQLVDVARQLLPEAGLPADLNDRIVKDAAELIGDLKGAIPEPAAHLSFSFLTPRGVEGYSYDWTQNLYLDASKPLELLNHAGGSPLLAAVSRSKYSPQQYESLRKWVQKAFGYFEEIALPRFNGHERDEYTKFKEFALPLVQRLDKATGTMLLPALADGQVGLVLDAKLKSKSWFREMPQGDQELPMLEAAIVFGVSDAELLKKACDEYRAVADIVFNKAKEMHPGEIPADFKLPSAESREVKPGTLYWYKIPADEMGIDAQLLPNAGLSKNVAVLSLEPAHTEQLLTSTPLVVTADGPLSDRSRPLASAASFNWAGTIDAAGPWIDFAVRQFAPRSGGAGQIAEAANDDPSTRMILDQVHTFLEILKVLRTTESATYQDGAAMVTHSLTVFHDVE